jgi:hypothetical protein
MGGQTPLGNDLSFEDIQNGGSIIPCTETCSGVIDESNQLLRTGLINL